MEEKRVTIQGVVVEETSTITFVEVCNQFNVTEEFLKEIMEHGLFQSESAELLEMSFDQKSISKIRSAQRLQEDLGVNIPGVVLVLELLEEMEALRKELHILRHHVNPF
jgi:chaperone modulatory protein CbpM